MGRRGRRARSAAATVLVVAAGCSAGRQARECWPSEALQIGGRAYSAIYGAAALKTSELPEVALTATDLTDEVGRVTTALQPCDALRDGGAYNLAVGTVLYKIAGFPTWFRLAARDTIDPSARAVGAGEVRVYQRLFHLNPAVTADDIVDLSHVRVIEARDDRGTQRTFNDPAVVANFTALVRGGRVINRQPDNTSPTVMLRLGLDRGPPIVLSYWPERATVDRIIVNPTLNNLLGIGPTFGTRA